MIELKILHTSLETTIADGLEQLLAYMDRCAAHEGHLAVFDRTPTKTWEDKVFHRQEQRQGHILDVWGM
ncbi:MAG: hypothetical protein FJZ47_02865 [Candidatus Tectomicrobia bacterium]|uniref:Uncharacterized protein n=1 Tax=Tectimicrobiota bacterium TaxID=2528274 RepID=A0A938AZL2_UNCTE|nr:hypothetical protein [Candidatus Tectomicrobia bacterium]